MRIKSSRIEPQSYSIRNLPIWLILLQGFFLFFIVREDFLAVFSILLCSLSIVFIISGPSNGLILLPLFLYLPFKIPGLGGIQFSEIGTFLVLLSFVFYLLLTKSDLELDTPALTPVTLILLASFLSIVNAKYFTSSIKDILKFLSSFVIILYFTTNFIRKRETISKIFMSFIISGLIAAIIGIARYVQGYDSRVFGLLGGGFGAFIGISILMAINMLVLSNKKGERLVVLFILPVMVSALLLSQTRAWLFGFILALIFLLYNLRGMLSIRFIFMLSAVVFASFVFLWSDIFTASQSQLITKGTSTAFETGLAKGDMLTKYVSILMRIFIWIHCFSIYMQSPILGYGIGNLRIRNYFSGELGPPSDPHVGYVDNHWLQVLFETGILGIIGWIWLAFIVYKSCKKLVRISNKPEWKLVALSLSGTMIIFLVGGMFWSLTVVHEMTAVIPFLIGLVFASLRIIESEEIQDSPKVSTSNV